VHIDMRHVFEQFGAEMLRRADAGMAVGKLAGLRFGERDQFRHGLDRHLGRNGEHVRRDEDLRDRAKSFCGSKGSVSYRLGLMTSDGLPPISNV